MFLKYQVLNHLKRTQPGGDPLNGPFFEIPKGDVLEAELSDRNQNEIQLTCRDGRQFWCCEEDVWEVEPAVFIVAGSNSCIVRVDPKDAQSLYELWQHNFRHNPGGAANFPDHLRRGGVLVYEVHVVTIQPDGPHKRIVPIQPQPTVPQEQIGPPVEDHMYSRFLLLREVDLGPPAEGEPSMVLAKDKEFEARIGDTREGRLLVWPRYGLSFWIEPEHLRELPHEQEA